MKTNINWMALMGLVVLLGITISADAQIDREKAIQS